MSNLKPINLIYYDKKYLKSEDNINYESNYDKFIENIFNKFEIKNENKSKINVYVYTSNNIKYLIENSQNFNNINPSEIIKIELIYKNISENIESKNFENNNNSNYELNDYYDSINLLNKNESINFNSNRKNYQIEENSENISNINYITESENFNEKTTINKNYSKKTTLNNNNENYKNNDIFIEESLKKNNEDLFNNLNEYINKIINSKLSDFENKIIKKIEQDNIKSEILNINNNITKNKIEIKELIENENSKLLNLIKELFTKINLSESTDNEDKIKNKYLIKNYKNNNFQEEYNLLQNDYINLKNDINNIKEYLKDITNKLTKINITENYKNNLKNDENNNINFFNNYNIKQLEKEFYSIEYITNEYDMLIEKLSMEQSLINITIKNNGKISWPENCYLCQINNNNKDNENNLYFENTLINFGEKVKPNKIVYTPILIKAKGKIELKNYFISYEVRDKNFKQLNVNNFGYLNLKIYNLEKSYKINNSIFIKNSN